MHHVFHFMKRFCGPGELVEDVVNIGSALEKTLLSLDNAFQALSRRISSFSDPSLQETDELKAVKSLLTFAIFLRLLSHFLLLMIR